MPYRSTIRPDLRLRVAAFTGRVSGRDVLDAYAALFDAPAWSPGFDEVLDVTGAPDLSVSDDHLAALVRGARRERERLGVGRVACVVSGCSQAVMVRLFTKLAAAGGREYRAVQTVGEAAAWLERDANTLAAALDGLAPPSA